jgi:hypothetical protein
MAYEPPSHQRNRSKYRDAYTARSQNPEHEALRTHTYLSERDKLARGYPPNIWDAARAYREKEGFGNVGLRDVLKIAEFRDAWHGFRGGGLAGNAPTSNKEKLAAAATIGWYDPDVGDDDSVWDRLRAFYE